uniref:CUB domain-containing protein n=1 Tax=Syphacia muris TaxID=451379 RepID=A0A0N5ASU2_9BILA
MEQMRTLERVVETRIDMLEFENADEVQEDCPFCRSLDCDIIFALLFTFVIGCLLVLIMAFWLKECDQLFNYTSGSGKFVFPIIPKHNLTSFSHTNNHVDMQCVYTFIARKEQRVKLIFDEFQLDGDAENCNNEYVDLYSELKSTNDDLLKATFGGRYCGSVPPYVRVSLYNVIKLVYHSRTPTDRFSQHTFRGRYTFLNADTYNSGTSLPNSNYEYFMLIVQSFRSSGTIRSPTYPGVYPQSFHCSYLLKGTRGKRVRLTFADFDVYFGGTHCPYDSLTIYDGASNKARIIRKACGLHQNLVLYSSGPYAFIEFNSTKAGRSNPRGYVIEYEFSDRYVNVQELTKVDGRQDYYVTHIIGTECDVRVKSNKESTHYIQSPEFPNGYPPNTTCTYIIDGMQGEQDLEKVTLKFQYFAVFSEHHSGNQKAISSAPTSLQKGGADEDGCSGSFVGIAYQETTIKTVLSSTDESTYDLVLCDRIFPGSNKSGPYPSAGPRMVLVFSTAERVSAAQKGEKVGFRAQIQFQTDFGIPGKHVGNSDECSFEFGGDQGTFNSPRYPSNYPHNASCRYVIDAEVGYQVQIYFEQFALFNNSSPREEERCGDFLELYDVFEEDRLEKQDKPVAIFMLSVIYCANSFPSPTISAFNSHKVVLIFRSDSAGTANGFKAFYKRRKAFAEAIPARETEYHCGRRIVATADVTSGTIVSKQYPTKYVADTICDWEIEVRPKHKIRLGLIDMDVEGEMKEVVKCDIAVIRIRDDYNKKKKITEMCGTEQEKFIPYISANNKLRITFLTAPEKVNGLKGFNFTWTEVMPFEMEEECKGPENYACSHEKLCISAKLRCDGLNNCGDNNDEEHCKKLEQATDLRTLLFAAVFSGCIFLFIFGFFCYLLRKKFAKKKLQIRHHATGLKHLRQPYRSQKPLRANSDKLDSFTQQTL